MVIFYSGGSAIAETGIPDPAIMLSYFVTVKKGKPDKRLRRILDIRKAALSKGTGDEGQSEGQAPRPKVRVKARRKAQTKT